MFILGLVLYGTLGASRTRMAISFQKLGTFLIEPPQIFSQYCFFLSSSSICIWACLILSQRSLRWSLFILSLLFGFASFTHHSIFQLTYPFFWFSYPATGSFQGIFNFSNYVVHLCLFFISFGSLLNVDIDSFIISVLFSRFWIIFTIVTLNSLSGSLRISSLFIWSCEFLPCSFICAVFLSFPFFWLTVFQASFAGL